MCILINKLCCVESNILVIIVFVNFLKFYGGGGVVIM